MSSSAVSMLHTESLDWLLTSEGLFLYTLWGWGNPLKKGTIVQYIIHLLSTFLYTNEHCNSYGARW